MTCTSCEAKVKSSLLQLKHVEKVEIYLEQNEATISMSKHIPLSDLQKTLPSKYIIQAIHHNKHAEIMKSWWENYKPIVLIFIFIGGGSALVQIQNTTFKWMEFMRYFMAAFFLVFSFFKLLNIQGFVDSYKMYDVVAMKFPAWAKIYVFIELTLGIAYLIDFNPLITNSVTLVVMSISIIGVLKSVLNKQKIQCACLGDVFNLPMSTVTIVEDALMIIMAALMLLTNF
jgi:cation transport ATPase